ncbi:UNVERIFIED_CONTAM: hypothetical protein ABID98_003020 [Brevibacillus sp. OAP136]
MVKNMSIPIPNWTKRDSLSYKKTRCAMTLIRKTSFRSLSRSRSFDLWKFLPLAMLEVTLRYSVFRSRIYKREYL